MSTALTPASLLSRRRQLLLSGNFFSTSTAAPAISTPFPSFRAAKSAILAERDPDALFSLFSSNSVFPTFLHHRRLFDISFTRLSLAKRGDLVERLLLDIVNDVAPRKPSDTRGAIGSPDLTRFAKLEGFWIRIMMLYAKAGLVDQAMGVVNLVKEKNCCPVTEKVLCAVLSVHLQNDKLEDLGNLLNTTSRNLSVTPTVLSHNLVLKGLVKKGDLDAAKHWVKDMKSKGGNEMPNMNSYCHLMDGHLKIGDFASFDQLLKEVTEMGLVWSVTTYHLKVVRLCNNKECVRANNVLIEMLEKGIKPSSASYNIVIDGFARLGDFESAKKVLERMESDCYTRPCSAAYFSLIRNMVRKGEIDSALEVFKQIAKRKWVPPSVVVKGLVDGLVERTRAEEAKEVIETTKKRLKGKAMGSWGKIETLLQS
ncbi:hypothetical protein MLD38_011262 [Melastoma candidum]|uniref:Uncharacterized protein n=1 Tax=Melastoma candidum TaxID=119954 RepID=A0ACB9R606_9MYRT|nr:hypothetical protein MLD38_011262 [Melastoma candidum]